MRRLLALLLCLAIASSGSWSTGEASAVGGSRPTRGVDLGQSVEQPIFWLGANYEGPADRSWRMWEDGQFDPTLIAADLERARTANLAVLRIFVQRALAADILAGRWTKLDRVLDLADDYGLKLIVTFADYDEPDLLRLAQVDRSVAARYRGRPTILAYDLKNEPRFGDLALARYPAGVGVGLQDPSAVAAIGETIERETIAEYRASEQGRREIPERLTDDQAWVYANVLAAYRQLLQNTQDWVRKHDSTVVRYLLSPESAAWHPLLQAINDSLASWLAARLDGLRSADPDRPLTVGQVDAILASMSANAVLDYWTVHRYPPASSAGIRSSMALFADLRSLAPTKPLLLGEFGFSGATVDEELAARLEAEMVRAVRDHGGAGALKWMLNDFPHGSNPRENAFGIYRADGSAKPVVGQLQALGPLQPIRHAATVSGSRSTTGLRPAGDPCRDVAAQAGPSTRFDLIPQPTTWVVVADTGGQGVYVRRTPRLADTLVAWPEGTRLEVIGPDADGDGLRWKPVRDPCGRDGWVPARYLAS